MENSVRTPRNTIVTGQRSMKIIIPLLVIASLSSANADETHYVGQFNDSSPIDSATCGTLATPCATIDYWTKVRRPVELDDCSPDNRCTVKIAPGLYTSTSASGCIVAGNDQQYEGPATIDIAALPTVNAAPCYGMGISGLNRDYSNFTATDLTLLNSPANGVLLRAPSGSHVENVLLKNIRVENSIEGAIHIENQFDQNVDCSVTGRRVSGLRIVDATIVNSHGVGGAIAIGCASGVTVDNANITDAFGIDSDTGTVRALAECRADVNLQGCDDHDGILFAGVVDGSIINSRISGCGEDGIDIGGHWKKSRRVVVENNDVEKCGVRSFKLSGGADTITIRSNNFRGRQMEIASCTHDSVVELNKVTVGNSKAFLCWEYFRNSTVRGNTFVSDRSGATVQVSHACTNDSIDWHSNTIKNLGTGPIIEEIAGPKKCNPLQCPGDCPNPWPAAQESIRLFDTELSVFRKTSNKKQWFGPGTGRREVWGEGVRPGPPSIGR